MKLLLDENLSRRIVPFLQHDFPGTSQVVLLGMASASDKEVWEVFRFSRVVACMGRTSTGYSVAYAKSDAFVGAQTVAR